MTKSELIENLSTKHPTSSAKEVEGIVKDILELIAQSLEEGNRIEVRGLVASLYTIVSRELAVIPKPGICKIRC